MLLIQSGTLPYCSPLQHRPRLNQVGPLPKFGLFNITERPFFYTMDTMTAVSYDASYTRI
jgi:hypothetical protein